MKNAAYQNGIKLTVLTEILQLVVQKIVYL